VSGAEAKRRGDWGEDRAAEYLLKQGCRILERGYRSRFGEIDLIALWEPYLCFVEVKLRKSDGFTPARSSVDRRKQERVRITAELYLAEHPELLQQPRFDVAEVYAPQGTRTAHPRIVYLENAF